MASTAKLALLNQAVTVASLNSTPLTLSAYQRFFVGFLKVSAIDGATTATVKIQHSPNQVDWFDVVSFTPLVGVTGSQVKDWSQFTIAGMALFPNIRGVVTLAGGAPTATIQLDLWYDPQKN